MVQEQSDKTWASFMNALNKPGPLDSYIDLINILKNFMKNVLKEKYASIKQDLHALNNSIVLMITEIKSFAAIASQHYVIIKDQLMIVDEIFKDARDCSLNESQKESVEYAIDRIMDGLAEINKILEKTNDNLQTRQKIRDLEESIVNKKIQLNEKGKVKVAEHLNNNKYKYAGGAAACGAVAAGSGATFVVLSEGLLGAAGECCLGELAVPSTLAISIPTFLGGALMFVLVNGVINLTKYFVDNSVKNDDVKLENLVSEATKLKNCTDTIAEVAIGLNESKEITNLNVKNLQSCIKDCFQLKMYGKSSKIDKAIEECENIKAKLDEISQISL